MLELKRVANQRWKQRERWRVNSQLTFFYHSWPPRTIYMIKITRCDFLVKKYTFCGKISFTRGSLIQKEKVKSMTTKVPKLALLLKSLKHMDDPRLWLWSPNNSFINFFYFLVIFIFYYWYDKRTDSFSFTED